MSLIYDYLKIHGKSDFAWDSDAEIPPTLKSDSKRHTRSDSERLNSKTVSIILGSCVVIGLFIFLVVKIFTPEEDVQIAADSESLPIMQVQPDTAPLTPESKIVVQQQEEPVSIPAADSLALEQARILSENAIQVFPEPESPATERADAMQQHADLTGGQPSAIRKKIPQTLELSSSARKSTFPEESPIYTEVKQPVEKVTQPIPIHDDVSVQRAYQPIDSQDKVIDVPSRIYFSPRPDSTPQDKSQKLYQAGLHAQQSGDQRIAEIYYKKALTEFPKHMEAMINLSALYVQQEKYIEAEEVLAVIIKNDPANSKALVNMGVINLYKYNEPLAEEQFRAALDANPVEENALVNLAYLAEKKMDYASAEKYYRHLLQINPENLLVLLAYGHLLEGQKRYSEAVALYRDCLKLEAVKLDRKINDKITQRVRLLAGAVRER